MAINVSSLNRAITPNLLDQILDGKTTTEKWFFLNQNRLDGLYKLIDQSGNSQVGYYSQQASDSRGIFTPPIRISIKGIDLIRILRIAGSDNEQYPVHFKVNLLNKGVVLFSYEELHNNQFEWQHLLTRDYNVDEVEWFIYQWSTSNHLAAITEISKIPIFFRKSVEQNIISILEKQKISYGSKDYIKLKVLENKHITNIVKKVDLETLSSIESSYLVKNFTVSDSSLIKLNETSNITVINKRPEIYTLNLNEVKHINVYAYSSDSGNITILEETKPSNIHTLMNARDRQIYGKVEIIYTDPVLDKQYKIKTSELNPYTDTSALINSQTQDHLWFNLFKNDLSGKYILMPEQLPAKANIGFWGTQLSTSSGHLNNPVIIDIDVTPSFFRRLALTGSISFNNVPKNFVVRLILVDDTVQDINIQNNTNINWQTHLATPKAIKHLQIVVTDITQGNMPIMITEIVTLLREIYEDEDITSIDVLEELDYVEASIQLGAISSNEVHLVLSNIDKRFDFDNKDSQLYGLLLKNRKVKVWFGAEIIPGTIEWYPRGVFYTTQWNVPSNSLIATCTALDLLELLRGSTFYKSFIYENYTLKDLFLLVLQDAPIAPEQYHVDDSLDSIRIPYAWFTFESYRDALQRLASCGIVQLYCDVHGVIQITLQKTTSTVFTELNSENNIMEKTRPYVWDAQINTVNVTWAKYDKELNTQVLSLDSFIIPANSESVYRLEYSTIPVSRIDPPQVESTDIQVLEYTSYAWGIFIKLKNSTNNLIKTKITINGDSLKAQTNQIVTKIDTHSVEANGSLTLNLTHEFLQSQEYAEKLAQDLLTEYSDSKYDINLDCRGDIALELGQRINIDGASNSYGIKRQKLNWDGFFSAQIETRKF